MVRNTLSEETKSAKMPNGKGSKAFTPGIKLRFTVLHPATKITCRRRNLGLPMNLTTASLWRSVRVRRLKASSSSLAMAAMLNCVGFSAIWSDSVLFMELRRFRERRSRIGRDGGPILSLQSTLDWLRWFVLELRCQPDRQGSRRNPSPNPECRLSLCLVQEF